MLLSVSCIKGLRQNQKFDREFQKLSRVFKKLGRVFVLQHGPCCPNQARYNWKFYILGL